ncbi:sigma-70 family RNA polymerase sigma factor [Paeniglutamicibacter cryotolerans]
MVEEARTASAVEQLHRLHAGRVYGYAYRRVRDIELARQVTNDVFRIAWQRELEPGPEALPWLLVTARNLVANEVRALGREAKLRLKLAAEHMAAGRASDADASAAVHEVLGSMRPKDREVLMLAYWDDMDMAQMAALLECSVESAKSRLFRARKAFGRLAPTTLLKGGSK